MPTPFNHMVMAGEVLADPGLKADIREFLEAQWGAFLFGNTAPDVQVVSGQTREATHFFNIPRTDDIPAQVNLFRAHPELAGPSAMPPTRAAFLAGYLSHLLLDELWIDRIFVPYFGLGAHWGGFRRRLLIHNVLRTHLDRLDFPRLNHGTDRRLRQATPDAWLPFTEDRYLVMWRDEIADQLVPGATVRTVEVFARRMHMQPAELEALLTPESLEENVFRYLPEAHLYDFLGEGRERSIRLLNEYLNTM